MNKKTLWIAAGLLLAAVIFFSLFLSKEESLVPVDANNEADSQANALSSKVTGNGSGISGTPAGTKAEAEAKNLSPRVRRFYQREINRIGQTTDEPELAANRLRSFAELLNAEELNGLGQHALDESANADARFLSAYLLAQSGSSDALGALLDIAKSEIPTSKDSTKNSFELSLRAQAIEGIAKQSDKAAARAAAREVANQAANSFLVDRAQRVIHELDGGNSVISQDEAALEELLEKRK